MIKVVFKEPVTSGHTPQGELFPRGLNWIKCLGEITQELQKNFEKALQENGVLSFVEANHEGVLIPARNIAWIQVDVNGN